MKTPCKSCKNLVETDFAPERMCVRFNEFGQQLPGHNDKWLCFKCDDEVCFNCYTKHNTAKHPEIYRGTCTGCKKPTDPEGFVEYGICKPCVDSQETK